jgi:hypothetical protein
LLEQLKTENLMLHPHFPPRRPLLTTAAPRLRDSDPVTLARRLGLDPDETQQLILRSASKRGLLNCTRQWGKSTVSVAKAVHHALTVDGTLVVVASPCLRQSGEWMRKAAEMLRRIDIEKQGDGYNRLSLQLRNGSRIVGLPDADARVRGYSVPSMIVIDEAARVSDELYYLSLRAMLSGNGSIWMLSTPCGKRGFFYDAWEFGRSPLAQAAGSVAGENVPDGEKVPDERDRWERFRVTAVDCPRIPRSFIEEQRAVLSANHFRQEHMCEFVGSARHAFDRDFIDDALDHDLAVV